MIMYLGKKAKHEDQSNPREYLASPPHVHHLSGDSRLRSSARGFLIQLISHLISMVTLTPLIIVYAEQTQTLFLALRANFQINSKFARVQKASYAIKVSDLASTAMTGIE